MAVDLTSVNSKIVGGLTSSVTRSTILNALGWLVVGVVVIGFIGWYAWYYFDKKKYDRIIQAHSVVNGFFDMALPYRDIAKPVKIGKGGFELIYLKKLKAWKLAHGARSGPRHYVFFIMSDGYWYPGQVLAAVHTMTPDGGLLKVVTTNPNMRAQYTSLEKQIDTLHAEKKSFWKEYGPWILGAIYISIIGIFSWLSYREVGQFLGSGTALADQMTKLADEMNRLAVNLHTANNGGLVPAQ